MKLEIKTNNKGYCEEFKIDGKDVGLGVYEINIKIQSNKLPEIILKVKSDEFILDSENNKIYLEKYKENQGE